MKHLTIKKSLLKVLLLLFFFTSCELKDDNISAESTQTMFKEKTETSFIDLYFYVVNSYKYNSNLNYFENILSFEKHVNSKISSADYSKIDIEKLSILNQADVSFLNELNFSVEFKIAINDLIDGENISNHKFLNDTEIILYQNLVSLHFSDDNIDKLNRDRRTIAFAFGAQKSIKDAVLYAGAVELLRYK